MMQTFEYPNLLVNSRSGTLYFNSERKSLPGVRMRDGVVGDYQRVTLDADAKGWAYLCMEGVGGVGDVPEGTELAISVFVRVNGGPRRLRPSIQRGDGTGFMHDWVDNTTRDDVGEGWTLCVTMAVRNATAYDSQMFFVNVGTDLGKAGTTLDIAQPMVCVTDEPHAWAPAEGEVWPE